MQLSYAQLMEDAHLDRVLGDRVQGVYVDVGAGHPVADNVSFHFYLRGWRGLVVEPQADLAALYARLRPRDRVVDCLVGRAAGRTTFHRVERLHGFSTMIEANAMGARAFGADYSSEEKDVVPLSRLIDEAGLDRIDFLKIDVEGAEAEVLAGIDWARHRPSVLCIEAIRPGSGQPSHDEWEPLLLAARFEFAFSDGLNRFYVAAEESALAARFPREPLPWDSVRHLYEFGRPHREAIHPDHVLAGQLIQGFLARLPHLDAETLRTLLAAGAARGAAEPAPSLPEGDELRAALGRIAAAYDGGMIWEDEAPRVSG
ncbi:FkbM family methyltransferase [Rhabdaerophilum calidifontis]|uniref:FkbM family methyltransferase n=1 Tax=Rhabdaerophilum calidifontis TaxID=2604328 RepID=UPI001239CEAC|nr:FkbM family methyltransferase [Rhabdaerophilum calidifontis]